MTRSPDCPMCQTPNPWEARHSTETYGYKGQQFSLNDSEYSVCRECGFDVVLPRQKRRNEARIRDEHRRIDGLLTGPQIKAIRKRLGLTQAEAARLMGGGDNAFSKYERGEVTQSVAMNQLLLVLAAVPDALEILATRKSPALVHSEHISQLMTVQIHDGFTDRPIRHRHTTRVNVERARTYPDELLAA